MSQKKPPTKYCPSCRQGVHVRTLTCACGHRWPKKLKDVEPAKAGRSTPRGQVDNDPMPIPPKGPASEVYLGEIIAPAGPCPVPLPEIDLRSWFSRLTVVTGSTKISGHAVRYWAVKELEHQLYGIRDLILSQYSRGDNRGDGNGDSGKGQAGGSADQGSGPDNE